MQEVYTKAYASFSPVRTRHHLRFGPEFFSDAGPGPRYAKMSIARGLRTNFRRYICVNRKEDESSDDQGVALLLLLGSCKTHCQKPDVNNSQLSMNTLDGAQRAQRIRILEYIQAKRRG